MLALGHFEAGESTQENGIIGRGRQALEQQCPSLVRTGGGESLGEAPLAEMREGLHLDGARKLDSLIDELLELRPDVVQICGGVGREALLDEQDPVEDLVDSGRLPEPLGDKGLMNESFGQERGLVEERETGDLEIERRVGEIAPCRRRLALLEKLEVKGICRPRRRDK